MVLLLFPLLKVLYYLNTPLLYSVLNHHWCFYLVLPSKLKALTALDPLPANRLVVGIFTINCTKFLSLYYHPTKENH